MTTGHQDKENDIVGRKMPGMQSTEVFCLLHELVVANRKILKRRIFLADQVLRQELLCYLNALERLKGSEE